MLLTRADYPDVVHLGECKPIIWSVAWHCEDGPGRPPTLLRPWPRFQVFDESQVLHSKWIRWDVPGFTDDEPIGPPQVSITVANGSAVYDLVGFYGPMAERRLIVELREGEYEPIDRVATVLKELG
jgi:hypothetical protein